MLQIAAKRSLIVCAGVGGTGKSTFALRLLVNGKWGVVFVFDPEGEYAQRLRITPCQDEFDLSIALIRGLVVFDPHYMFPGDLQKAFTWFCENWVFNKSEALPGRKLFIVDEVWKYCSPNSIPHELALIIQTGRKRGLTTLVNTQRPNKLNDAILNEMSEMVCFRLQGERALLKAAEYGFDQEELKNLATLHLVGRNLDTNAELRGRIKI